jgi:competence protein ComEC
MATSKKQTKNQTKKTQTSSTRKTSVRKTSRKKQNPTAVIISLVLILCILLVLYFTGWYKYLIPTDDGTTPKDDTPIVNVDPPKEDPPKEDNPTDVTKGKKVSFQNDSKDAELTITYLELIGTNGSQTVGDATFIQYGNVDILIDAGEKSSGTATVVPYLQSMVKDKVLELVICTHPDSDHLGGMVGNKKTGSDDYLGVLFMNDISIKYLVDFGYDSTTQVYSIYQAQVKKLIEKGMIYDRINDAMSDSEDYPNEFVLGNDTSLKLLDTKTYAMPEVKDDNDRSVCALLTSGTRKFLFTGDSEIKEEKILADMNLGHVDVYKSNHHGSPTANSTAFLDTITPDYIIIESSASNSYYLPKKTIVARLYEYTDKTYATFLDGNITITCRNNQITISSAHQTLTNILTSDWYLSDEDADKNPRP